jgi:hypothetical protein
MAGERSICVSNAYSSLLVSSPLPCNSDSRWKTEGAGTGCEPGTRLAHCSACELQFVQDYLACT